MKADIIYNKSSENMSEIDDGTIGLVVTSPPYNVGIEYGGSKANDKRSLNDWLTFQTQVYTECYRVLDYGGRLVINVANTGRKPYIPLTSYLTIKLQSIGFSHNGIIIWDKGASAAQRTSWGSWQSASAPGLRDVNEFILVFSKGLKGRRMKGTSTITTEEFLCYTESIWHINAESASRIVHPAPFPEELPRRVIKLFSYLEDCVLDPFMGSGTTALVASSLGRKYIGYELQQEYIDLANKRISENIGV